MRALVALNGRVTLWLARIAMVVLAIVALVTFSDVIARYFFNAPFTFTVEFTEISMALIVFLSVGIVTHESGHIAVDVVTLRLRDRMRAIFSLIVNALALVFLALMVWRLSLQAMTLFAKNDHTPIWGFPLWPVGVAVTIGAAFYVTGTLLHLLDSGARATGRDGIFDAAPRDQSFRE